MTKKFSVTAADIMAMEDYAKIRADSRKRTTEIKRNRRVSVGPDATFYFENFETMWHQIHEMLHIERGGSDQIPGELEAYNPLIPKRKELVATLMFEIEDPERRARTLAGLGGVEETVNLSLAGHVIQAQAEEDIDRTTADGKASSIQFLHFPFTPGQVAAFRQPNAQITIGIGHPAYGHMAILPEPVRSALSDDFAD